MKFRVNDIHMVPKNFNFIHFLQLELKNFTPLRVRESRVAW